MGVPSSGAYQPMLARPLSMLLLCLLVLALPAQGVLAVAMQSSMLESSLQHQSQAHSLATEQGPCVEESFSTGVAPAHFLSEHRSCNLCLFCVGALASGPELLLSPLPASALLPATRLQHFVGYIADTPERPPRHLLA